MHLLWNITFLLQTVQLSNTLRLGVDGLDVLEGLEGLEVWLEVLEVWLEGLEVA